MPLIVELEFKNNILTENDCVENIYILGKKFFIYISLNSN